MSDGDVLATLVLMAFLMAVCGLGSVLIYMQFWGEWYATIVLVLTWVFIVLIIPSLFYRDSKVTTTSYKPKENARDAFIEEMKKKRGE